MEEIDFEKEFGESKEESLKDRLFQKYLELKYLTENEINGTIDINIIDGEHFKESKDFKRGFEAGIKLMSMLIFK
ncbi:MAG: hypothetical protein ACI4PF_05205 [Christensenellales bacterium]